MTSTFGMLETAKSGLSVSMQNLKITGHNLANANTVGYSRQRLITSAKELGNSTYLLHPVANTLIGQGVEVLSVQQVRSEYLDNQYRDLHSGYKYSDSTTQSLTYLEGLFNAELSDGEGLTGSIEDFFAALNTFTSDTTSEENRIAVQKSAVSLTQHFNLVYQEMEALWIDQNTSVATTAQSINSLATKIAELNKAIASYERRGEIANDLRDERNLLLDELSGYVNISYENDPSNPSIVNVRIGELDLVSGTKACSIEITSKAEQLDQMAARIAQWNNEIQSSADPDYIAELQGYISQEILNMEALSGLTLDVTADGNMRNVSYDGKPLVAGSQTRPIGEAVKSNLSVWVDLCSNRLSLGGVDLSIQAGTVQGGELYAHLEQISSFTGDSPGIPYYMDQLNELARSIARGINSVHLTGYSYDTDPSELATTSETGIYFFHVDTQLDADGKVINEYYDKITAGNFTLSSEVAASPWNIAGSREQVNSHGTTQDTGVATDLYADLAKSGYFSKLNGIVGHLAIALNTNKSLLDTKQSLLNSVDTQRTSISGVSQDEETTNLIVYQQSYNACARVITTIDEMLENMITRMGIVGR